MALFRAGQQITAKLPEIGRIFKGGKKRDREKEGKTYQIMGEDLNHFRFEPAEATKALPSPDGNGSLADYLSAKFAELGDEPRNIPIQFLKETVAENFEHQYNELWKKIGNAERCIRRCDGVTTILSLTEDKKLTRLPIPCAAAEGANECPFQCKPVGRLRFVIPALGYPGLIVMTTHSIYDVIELAGNLAFYDGKLSKLPFQLCRTEKTISHEDKALKKWLCHLTVDPRFGNAMLAAAPRQYLAEIEGTTMDADVIEDDIKQLMAAEPTIKDRITAKIAELKWTEAQKKEWIGSLGFGAVSGWTDEQWQKAYEQLSEVAA